MTVESLLIKSSIETFQQYTRRIGSCIGQLSDDQVWARDHENANSIGNLMLHLAGNLRQWIVSGLGGAADARKRASEFAARGGMTADEMFRRLESTVEEAIAVISPLDEARLLQTYRIQDIYEVSGVEAVLHVVEHFAHHTGQIIFATKLLTGEDLGFYAHLSHQGKQDA